MKLKGVRGKSNSSKPLGPEAWLRVQKQYPVGSRDVWKKLLDLCGEFYEMAPWDTFRAEIPFKFETALVPEDAVVVINGVLEECVGIDIFLGEDKYEYFMDKVTKLSEGAKTGDGIRFYLTLNLLKVEFVEMQYLQAIDRQLLRALNWPIEVPLSPQFRSFLPGYGPTVFTEHEAVLAALAITAAMDFTRNYQGGNIPEESLQMGVVMNSPDENALFEFPVTEHAEPLRVDRNPPREEAFIADDYILMLSLKQYPLEEGMKWQVDILEDFGIHEDGPHRPAVTRCISFVDTKTFHGNIPEVFSHRKSSERAVLKALLNSAKKAKALPEVIEVREGAELLCAKPYFEQLGIRIEVSRLAAWESYVSTMSEQMRARR